MRSTEKSMNMRSRTFNHSQIKLAYFFSSLLLITMCATAALAQYTTARLSGTVEDNTGAAVLGATVTVEQAGTSYKQAVKSGNAGEYLFPSLPVGSYQLTVEMAGFRTYVQKGISFGSRTGRQPESYLDCGRGIPASQGGGGCRSSNHRRCGDHECYRRKEHGKHADEWPRGAAIDLSCPRRRRCHIAELWR